MYQINDKAYSWLPLEQIDQNLMGQIIQVSALPIIYKHIAIMPDSHLGSGAMVGSCIPTQGGIIPSAVGSDIGCGMIAAKTSFTKDTFDMENLSKLRESIERSVPLSAGRWNKEYTSTVTNKIQYLEESGQENGRLNFYNKLAPRWRLQLGTLGSGNHFIELVLDEDDNVWVFLHSGSRGPGFKIGNHHMRVAKKYCIDNHIAVPNRELAYLTDDSPELVAYLVDMDWAQNWAEENRQEMLDRILKDITYYMDTSFSVLQTIKCTHNYIDVERHFGFDVFVTRKGAISAYRNELGLIPGSMGTRSYVSKGLGNIDAFCTAPHGAGRRFSRKVAKNQVTMDDFDLYMEGIEVKRSEAFLDELPHAYKDIDDVMEQSKTLVESVHEFRQFVNVKGN